MQRTAQVLLVILALFQLVIAENILLDAGSSGTKVNGQKITKLDALVKQGATLQYGNVDTDPKVVPDTTEVEARGSLYAEKIIKHKHRDHTIAAVLATAGMRQPIHETNQPKLWSGLCRKLSIADEKKCGVIPGTTEAFYEWIAARECIHVGQHGDACRSGIISMGGASAQIAIPLTEAQKEKWLKHRDDLIRNEDKYFHSKAHPIPSTGGGHYTENFFSYRPAKLDLPEIPFWANQKCSENKFVGIGLISFLAIDGPHRQSTSGPVTDTLAYSADSKNYARHIAGGANSVFSYFSTFHRNLCDGTTFDTCLSNLNDVLNTDPFWVDTIKFFKDNGFHNRRFDLITPSVDAIGCLAFFETREARDTVSHDIPTCGTDAYLEDVKRDIETYCSKHDAGTTGKYFSFTSRGQVGTETQKKEDLEDMEKCLKVMWIYTYVKTLLEGGAQHSVVTRKECQWSKGAELYLKIRTLDGALRR